MRIPQLFAGAAVACLLLGTPAFAQEAGDCDMICRLKGYLSTDHMAGDAGGDTAPAAPAKSRRQHVAAAHKPAAPKSATPKPATSKPVVAAVPPRPAVAQAPAIRTAVKTPDRATVPAKRDAAVARPAPAHAVAAVLPPPVLPPPVPARGAKPAPAKLAAAPAARKPAIVPAPVAATAPAAEPPKVRVAAAPHRTARIPAAPASPPTRTASLATAIPGSAPAMQAGFH